MRVCLVSTYPPRACGLGTFAARLRDDLLPAPGVTAVDVVAVVRGDRDPTATRPEVVHRLEQDDLEAYRSAADVINGGGYDVVCIQHEHGIYGGPAGLFVAELADRVDAPVVTTLHTVLGEPTEDQRRALQAVADASAALVVLSDAALPLLSAQSLGRSRVDVIPHGVPDVEPSEPQEHKAALGLAGRFVILTFGLLSANKGIEHVIEALPGVVDRSPQVCYVVLGATHPEVRRAQGEAYRTTLEARVEELGLREHVRFVDRYADDDDLLAHLRACDVYVTPYRASEQISSGTLAYAVGLGRAVVSTPYRYAQSLLADGVGRLVGFADVEEMRTVLNELVEDDDERARLRAAAYAKGREMTWPSVAAGYARLFAELSMASRLRSDLPTARPAVLLPQQPSLDRLESLTDDVGVLQHATYGIPDRTHGYTTDDNARALVAAVLVGERHAGIRAVRLAETYLGYLRYAQTGDGRFRNVLTYDRRWLDEHGTGDTLGQAVWGLGTAASRGPTRDVRDLARTLLDAALPALADLSPPRSVAYALCGLTEVLRSSPDPAVGEVADRLVDRLLDAFALHRGEGWPWCDEALTYASTKVPEALLLAADVRGRDEWIRVGCEALDFVLSHTLRRGDFAPVGNDGWYPADGVRAAYGQQPIEAGYTAQACAVAHRLTGRRSYADAQRAAIAWLLGRNAARTPLYDPRTGACADGLDREGVSRNTGAESVICALLGVLAQPVDDDRAPGPRDHLAPVVG